MRSPGMAEGLSRVQSGPAHARLFCLRNLKKSPVSHVEVSPWEKPVGLLQSRDRRELICMPRRQPVSRARGEQRQPNWLCRQKVLSYPHHDLPQEDVKHRTNNAIFPDHHLQDQQRVPHWSLSQPSVWR